MADLTVNELLSSYLRFADRYYVKDGTPKKDPEIIRLSIRPLSRPDGHIPGREFDPLGLKAVILSMIDDGLTRDGIKWRIAQLARAFKWAISGELILASVPQALRTVGGLRGRAGPRPGQQELDGVIGSAAWRVQATEATAEPARAQYPR